MKKVILFLFIYLINNSTALAIYIPNITTEIRPDTSKVIQEVANKDKHAAHLITIQVHRVDSPETLEPITTKFNDEVLFTPAKIILPPGGKANITFHYNGPKDDKERYYSISWTDDVIAYNQSSTDQPSVGVNVAARAIIQTVLLVNPRQAKLSYKLSSDYLINNGNMSFQATGYGLCKKTASAKDERCQRTSWLLPGRKTNFHGLDLTAKETIIGLWDGSHFVAIKK